MEQTQQEKGTWIFGYHSLIWKAGFEYDRKIVGFIKGRRRAFHLACFEHRGTWDYPARVATLEEDEDSICWGVALRIKGCEAKAMSYLRKRESEYDTIDCVEFFTEDSPDIAVVCNVQVFTSTPASIYYLGPASKEEIAKQIATATGPCGTNCEYLFRLVEALREIGHEDEEVLELASAVRHELNVVHQANNGSMKAVSNAGQSSVVTSQSIFSKPRLLIPIPVQGVPLNQSPRLVKSLAR